MKAELKREFRGRELDPVEDRRLLEEVYAGHRASAIIAGRTERPVDAPDRASVRRAIDAVEARIVEAVWTLTRSTTVPNPGAPSRHGVDYMQEAADRWFNAVAARGWDVPPPRPPLPSAKAIDAMYEPLEWLTTLGLLPQDRARLVFAAAQTKRGDTARRIGWGRVRLAMPELAGCSVRTLQRRYEDGLRGIVAVLAAQGRE